MRVSCEQVRATGTFVADLRMVREFIYHVNFAQVTLQI